MTKEIETGNHDWRVGSLEKYGCHWYDAQKMVFKETDTMSIVIVAQTKDGVCVAADSKETFFDQRGNTLSNSSLSLKKVYKNHKYLIGCAGLARLTYKNPYHTEALQPMLEDLFKNENMSPDEYVTEIARLIYNSDTMALFPKSAVTISFSYKKEWNYTNSAPVAEYITDYYSITGVSGSKELKIAHGTMNGPDHLECGELTVFDTAVKKNGLNYNKDWNLKEASEYCKKGIEITIREMEDMERRGLVNACTVGGNIQFDFLK